MSKLLYVLVLLHYLPFGSGENLFFKFKKEDNRQQGRWTESDVVTNFIIKNNSYFIVTNEYKPKEDTIVINKDTLFQEGSIMYQDTTYIGFVKNENGIFYIQTRNRLVKLFSLVVGDTIKVSEYNGLLDQDYYSYIMDTTYLVNNELLPCYKFSVSHKSIGLDDYDYHGITLIDKKYLIPLYIECKYEIYWQTKRFCTGIFMW